MNIDWISLILKKICTWKEVGLAEAGGRRLAEEVVQTSFLSFLFFPDQITQIVQASFLMKCTAVPSLIRGFALHSFSYPWPENIK